MPHKCIQCVQIFPTSREMVTHMRESHMSFVENAKNKIDRSQESSFEAKRQLPGNNATAAKCPFCEKDLQTRRKLMLHLELEHGDDDTEIEPQLKIIRLENDSKNKLFNGIDAEKNSEAEVQARKVSIVNNLLNTLGSIEGKSEVAVPGTSETIEVSATSIKLPEKRYKCFWCDASFRKRGKLMDHIDMFHKANKEQIEEEAGLLQTTGVKNTPPAKVTAPKKSLSTPTTQEKKSGISTTKSKAVTTKNQKKNAVPKQLPEFPPANLECPETPNNNVCTFTVLASITEVSRRKINTTTRDCSDKCTFFNRKKDNPLPPVVPDLIVEPMLLTQEHLEPEYTSTVLPSSIEMFVTQPSPQPPPPPYSDTYSSSMTVDTTAMITNANRALQSPTYSYLARPQPIHPLFDPQFCSYQQQIMFHMPPQELYFNQQQQQPHLHRERHQERQQQEEQQEEQQREQQEREQQEREQQKEEHQLQERKQEQQKREQRRQREEHQREQQQREQQQREQHEREQQRQQREQQRWEQQQLEQQKREQLYRKQQHEEQRKQQQREEQIREQLKQEQQLQEQQQLQKQLQEQQMRIMQYQHQRDIAAQSLQNYDGNHFLSQVTQNPECPLDLRLSKI